MIDSVGRSKANCKIQWMLFAILLAVALPVALLLPSALVAQPPFPKAFLSIAIDDRANINLWTELADDCAAHGFTTTFALDTQNASQEDWAAMRTRVAKGHEIAAHTKNHVPLVTEGVLHLRYYRPQTKSAIARVDSATEKLSAFIDNKDTPALLLPLVQSGPYASLGRLVDGINNVAGFSAELIDPYYRNIRSEFLSSGDDIDILFKAGFTPLFINQKRQARYELLASKQEIEKNIPGYVCKTVVYPFLRQDADIRSIAREFGYACGRTGSSGNLVTGAGNAYDPFKIWAQRPKVLFGEPGAPNFTERIQAFLEDLKRNNGAGCIYSHGPEEFTNEQWRLLLKILSKDPEIRISNIGNMAHSIMAKPPSAAHSASMP